MDNIEVIVDDIAGGRDEDNDMTIGKADMEPTIKKLIKIAEQNGLEKPYHFIILPKKIIFGQLWYNSHIISRMMLVDANKKAIRTGKLTWKTVEREVI